MVTVKFKIILEQFKETMQEFIINASVLIFKKIKQKIENIKGGHLANFNAKVTDDSTYVLRTYDPGLA